MKKEIDYKDYSWSWDDEGMLGDIKINCICGNKIECDVFNIFDRYEDLFCEKCGRKVIVERTTKVFLEDKN
jgi:hypothetical protein